MIIIKIVIIMIIIIMIIIIIFIYACEKIASELGLGGGFSLVLVSSIGYTWLVTN